MINSSLISLSNSAISLRRQQLKNSALKHLDRPVSAALFHPSTRCLPLISADLYPQLSHGGSLTLALYISHTVASTAHFRQLIDAFRLLINCMIVFVSRLPMIARCIVQLQTKHQEFTNNDNFFIKLYRGC